MKHNNRLIWMLFAVVSAGLRVWQNLAGYEDTGLARRGFLPGILLPVVLLAAAVVFTRRARSLPGRQADALRLAVDFRFTGNLPAAACAVAGSLLVMLGGVLFAASAAVNVRIPLGLFAVAAAACTLYTALALYRGNGTPQSLTLLVPICALVVFLVFLYRADASEPVLARIYVEILAAAALTYSATKRTAFAYGGSSPRRYAPAGAVAALLALTAASEGGSIARVALLAGCAAIEAAFLEAADFASDRGTAVSG